jgi:hypothetical protein
MNKRYIVRDKQGAYQSAYNLALGKKKAYEWAMQCAKSVNGVIYYVEGDSNNEEEVFRMPENRRS